MSTVLILGAASDMAVAIAEKFASKGYSLQLAAREVNRLAPLKSDVAVKFNTHTELLEFDALAYESHAAFFNNLSAKPDITICVFGYLGDHDSAMKNWAESAKIIHTNYTGAVSVLNIVADYYAAQKSGVIVGISSVAGERGRQSNYLYGSAKAGFTAYLSGLRNRLYLYKARVVSIQPGFVYTRMTQDLTLPALLTATPQQVAEKVFKAATGKGNVVYVKWFWRWIMLIIKLIPEFIFKKMKL